ncbi:MAG TPA: hypothetical protein VHL57_05830 [Flavobacteriales bacterium]|jgi:hypothetical protein|nr:hypothetical protein [Flavobacteriales bacterium]
MNTLSRILHCDGTTARVPYLRNTLLLAAAKAAIDVQVMALRPDLFRNWSWPLAWTNPYAMIAPWLAGDVPLLVCCTTAAFFTALVWNSVHRARHAGLDHRLGLALVMPFGNMLLLIALCIWPAAPRRSVFDLPRR